jgi:hypothetical protein
VLMHAHDGRVGDLHRRVMSGGQRFHDPVPDTCPPPADEAIVASRVRAAALRMIRNSDPGEPGITLPESASKRTWPRRPTTSQIDPIRKWTRPFATSGRSADSGHWRAIKSSAYELTA